MFFLFFSFFCPSLPLPPSIPIFPPLQPSHGDKTSNPEVLKWMNDLAKGRKQLKGKCQPRISFLRKEADKIVIMCSKEFFFFFFLKYLFLFIYFWLCWVFVSVQGLSLVVASGGHSSSRCVGLSPSRPLLLRSTDSRHAGSVVVAHRPSRSAACGIFPDQGSNPCPLHWQADSQPLRHQGSPPRSS